MGIFQSGQMGQTVNLLAFAFGGSNPSVPTSKTSSEDIPLIGCYSSVAEHFLGKEEVTSSNLVNSSNRKREDKTAKRTNIINKYRNRN